MRYFLYKITNKINGMVYVGKTKDLERRWYEHQRTMKQGKQHPLYDSMRKHGAENFSFELIQETNEEEVDALEIELIKQMSLYPAGYNLAEGGTGGDTFTNLPHHAKERKRLLHRENYKTKPQGISTKSKKGAHITDTYPEIQDQWKKNHNAAMKGLSERRSRGVFTEKEVEGHLKVRDYWSLPENKQKRSKLAKGVNNSRWLGYLEVYSADGTLLKVFESAKEAAVELGINANTIRVKAKNGQPYNCKKPGFRDYVGVTFKIANKKQWIVKIGYFSSM